MNRFVGQRVLIAGGASGMGAAAAEGFVREGARVVIGDIQDVRGEALADRLRAAGGDATYVHADCTVEADVSALVERTVTTLGGLDIAANVLGGGAADDRPGSSIHDTSLETFRRTMAISLESVFLLMQQEVAPMIAQGHGVIVNVSSMASLAAERHAPMSYGVAKAALNHLTSFAAADYAKHGIRVNAILPGTTSTPMLTENFSQDQIAGMLASQQAIQQLIQPEDQAAAILFLAAPEARMITGHLMPVDGGRAAFGLQGPSSSPAARALTFAH